MRTCTVFGDLASERSSEAYPTQNYCNECYESMAEGTEDSPVVSSQIYDPLYGEECASCGKLASEEE